MVVGFLMAPSSFHLDKKRGTRGSRAAPAPAAVKPQRVALSHFKVIGTPLSAFRERRDSNRLVGAPRCAQLFLLCSLICSEEKIKRTEESFRRPVDLGDQIPKGPS